MTQDEDSGRVGPLEAGHAWSMQASATCGECRETLTVTLPDHETTEVRCRCARVLFTRDGAYLFTEPGVSVRVSGWED